MKGRRSIALLELSGAGRVGRNARWCIGGVLAAAAFLTACGASGGVPAGEHSDCATPRRTLIAALGDSDTHSYRDEVLRVRRGGDHHEAALSWLEVWSALRGGEIDPGRVETAGAPVTIARIAASIGMPMRTPRKRDFAYNYAVSGADCASLLDVWPLQARRLVERIALAPDDWADGVVVVRIGVNDIGQESHVLAWADDPSEGMDRADACVDAIDRTVAEIRATTTARIALVSIHGDVETAIQPSADLALVRRANARSVLDRFDDGLRRIAGAHPMVAFVDGQAWMRERFPGNAPRAEIAGQPIYNERGDLPDRLHLADNHAGTVAGGLFLQSFLETVNDDLACGFTPVRDEEIVALIRPALEEGRRERVVSAP